MVVAEHPTSTFWFHLRGHLDGDAEISVMPPEAVHTHLDFSNHLARGDIDWRRGADYFSTGAVFHYKPLNVKSGVLIIEYSLY